MACEICGKSVCIRSFHSLDEQDEFDTKTGRFAPEPKEPPMMLDAELTKNAVERSVKSVLGMAAAFAKMKKEDGKSDT